MLGKKNLDLACWCWILRTGQRYTNHSCCIDWFILSSCTFPTSASEGRETQFLTPTCHLAGYRQATFGDLVRHFCVDICQYSTDVDKKSGFIMFFLLRWGGGVGGSRRGRLVTGMLLYFRAHL